MTQTLVRLIATVTVLLAVTTVSAETWTRPDATVYADVIASTSDATSVSNVVVLTKDFSVTAPRGQVSERHVSGKSTVNRKVEITHKTRTFFAEAFAFSFSTQELTIEGVSVSRRTES